MNGTVLSSGNSRHHVYRSKFGSPKPLGKSSTSISILESGCFELSSNVETARVTTTSNRGKDWVVKPKLVE